MKRMRVLPLKPSVKNLKPLYVLPDWPLRAERLLKTSYKPESFKNDPHYVW